MDLQIEEKSEIICGICGNSHKIIECNIIQMKTYIKDNIVPSKARLTLPQILRIEKMSEGSDVIVAADNIKKGTQFGPFEAKKLFNLSPEITFPLKLFTPSDYFSEYYLDSNNENDCNWMMFVPPAQNLEEQNLICFQDNLKIFFISVRDIAVGEFLKVWYSPYYAQKMNKEVLMSSKKVDNKILDLNSLLKKQQNLMERDIWTCKFCNLQEKDITRFATHISQHYSMQIRKVCEICKSMFMTHKGLRKHIRIVHANKSTVHVKEHYDSGQFINEKGEVKDSMLGGPLLNDVLTDSMDNTNLLLQQTDINHLDMQNIENNMLLDSDHLNLAVENFIHDSDNFNFNIDEDKEQHICDICLKPFSKLKRLVQHLQKHTGKYTCSECLVIFSRNENLKAHKCNLHKKEQYKCMLCEKKFSLKKYLSRHMLAAHDKKRMCTKCNRTYHCEKEIKEHNCSGIPDMEKEKYPCLLCNKTFYRESYIKKHMKSHTPTKKISRSDFFICEICAKTFHSNRNLRRHKKTHSETSYPCDKCDKSYTRLDTLKHHVILEHASSVHSCHVCGRMCKSKKYLRLHMTKHSTRKKHKCTACNRKFLQKSNMLKHFKSKHATHCDKCNLEDCVHAKSVIECFECPVCQKYIKLRSSVLRHIRKIHPNEYIDTTKIKKIKRMCQNYNARTKSNEQLIKENKPNVVGKCELKENEDNLTDLNISNNFNIVENLNKDNVKLTTECDEIKEQNDNTLDFSNLALELGSNLTINNQEICLSMPELGELDQDITLSDNAYMLENGTIVEPLDSKNVVVYIFDKKSS